MLATVDSAFVSLLSVYRIAKKIVVSSEKIRLKMATSCQPPTLKVLIKLCSDEQLPTSRLQLGRIV